MTEPAFDALAAAVGAACGVPDRIELVGEVDWDVFVQWVDRHRVATLVHRSGWLDRAGAPAKPREAVACRARADALESLRLLAVQRRVLNALMGVGVETVVLKGPPLSVDAHGEPAARSPGDLDILVAPESLGRAVDALRAAGLEWLGYRPPEEQDRPPLEPEAIGRHARLPMLPEATLTSEGVDVEVHWRLFQNPRLMPVEPSWLRDPRWVQMQDMTVPMLPLAALSTYVLVHGTNHLWARIKWLADVPALVLRHPELVRPDTLESIDTGYRRSVATGLLVAEAVFGGFLTPHSRAWAEDVRGTAMLRRQSLAAVRDRRVMRHVSPRALPGVVMGRLALRSDLGYRLDELRVLLLSAGRAQAIEDPGLATLAAGPLRWMRRAIGRAARPHLRSELDPVEILGGGARLLRMSSDDRRRALEAVADLTRASLELRLAPRRRTLARLGTLDADEAEERVTPAQLQEAESVGAAVARVARAVPWHPTCLRQALAVQRMLRRRGVANRLHLGVAGGPAIEAHAWVTVQGQPVVGTRGLERYVPLAAFK